MTTMTQAFRCLAGALLVSLTAGLPAAAQDSGDIRALQDRLQRLDRELVTVQQQVYQGHGGHAVTGAVPAPTSDADTAAAVTLQTRISALESELRTTTGQIEEANFAVGDIRQRLDRLVNDLDSRLAALEKAFANRPPPNAAVTPAAAPSATKPAAKADAPAAPVKLPKGSAKEQYEFAFDLLKRSDYPRAESALKQFVAAHPDDPLAPNAQYWLAETFFVRNNFGEAAAQFLAGYQKYPQAPKAPDNLVKLGLSLAKLGKTPEACAAFTRFEKEYPAATGALRGRVSDERQHLKCS
jgi:tol-pal system protein YbgF